MATLQDYYNQLGSIYDPQTALIEQQQAQIPGQFQAQKSALEQARVNAFKDISNTASSRGMTFSGFNPQQQATYVGEKFLPAMAGLATAEQESQNSLIQALNKINAERSQTALGYYESAQQAEAANAAKIQAAEMDRQAKIQAAQIAAQGNTTDPYKGFTTRASGNKTEDGRPIGVNFYGPGNQPITAAQYYYSTGGGKEALKSFLQSDSDKASQSALKYMNYLDNLVRLKVQGMTGERASQLLIEKYPYIFGV